VQSRREPAQAPPQGGQKRHRPPLGNRQTGDLQVGASEQPGATVERVWQARLVDDQDAGRSEDAARLDERRPHRHGRTHRGERDDLEDSVEALAREGQVAPVRPHDRGPGDTSRRGGDPVGIGIDAVQALRRDTGGGEPLEQPTGAAAAVEQATAAA
jgi:hypothetical protein